MNQITGYKFNIGENLDPDIYHIKDRIKLRLLELERKGKK
jgi:hypothetical protein